MLPGGVSMQKSAKLIALISGVVLATAACTSSGASTAPSVEARWPRPKRRPSPRRSRRRRPSIRSRCSARSSRRARSAIATDPNYKPFSFLNTTTNEYEGFDTEHGRGDGQAPQREARQGRSSSVWETPGWDTITAGSWGGRWDISIGSMSVTVGRAKVVDFTEPYYYDSGAVAVPKDSPIQSLAELNGGKTFCVGTATTYEQWLTGTLEIVDPNIVAAPTDPAGHGPADRQRVHPGRPGRAHVRRDRRQQQRPRGCRRQGRADPRARRPADLHRLRGVRARQERPGHAAHPGDPQRDRRRDARRRHPQGLLRGVAQARTSPPSRS